MNNYQMNVNLAFTADTGQAKAQLQDLKNQLSTIATQPVSLGQSLTPELQSAARAAAELKVHLNAATNIKTGMLDFGKLSQSIKQSGTSLSAYAVKLQQIGPTGQQAFMSLASAVAQSEVPIRRANALLTSMGITLKNTLKWQISSSLLRGFIGSVQKAYSYVQDLNGSLNDIRIVTGHNIDYMSKFAAQANEAAKALSTTTNEYAKASLIFYQQGLDDEAVKERTEVTLKMANVTGQSAQIVSDQLTAVWNNFDDGSKSLEYYADVMTALGAATASSTTEIAQGLEKFAAVAETVGLSYEYATTALSTVVAETRQSADVVGTAFKTLFARIQDLELGNTLDDGTTLGQYSEALAKVGVNIKDANGEMKTMDTILNEMGAKWDTLNSAQQVALAQSVAGVRQYSQLIALMDNWDKFQTNLNTAYDSSGTLQEQADTYAESWEAAKNRVRAAAEEMYSSLFKEDFFISLTNSFGKLLGVFNTFIDGIGGLSGVLAMTGVIITKVYGTQLAQSFRNLAYNLQMSTTYGRQLAQETKLIQMTELERLMNPARENALQYEQQTAHVYSQEVALQRELIEQTSHMTEQDKIKYQSMLDQHRLLGQQSSELAKQIDLNRQLQEESYIRALGQGMELGNKTYKEMAGYLEEIKTKAQGVSQLDKIFEQIKFKELSAAEGAKQLKNALIQAGASKDQLEKLKDAFVRIANGADTSKQAIQEVKAVMIQLSENSAKNILKTMGIKENSAAYKTLLPILQEYAQLVRQTSGDEERLSTANRNLALSFENIKKALAKAGVQTQDWASYLNNSINMLMSAGMLISSMNSLIHTLEDPDASGWEKFGSILTSVSMIVFSLRGTFTGLISVVKLCKAIFNKNTLAVIANTVASGLQAKANKKNTTTEVAETGVIKKQTAEINKNTAAEIANQNAKKAKQFKGKNGVLRTFSGRKNLKGQYLDDSGHIISDKYVRKYKLDTYGQRRGNFVKTPTNSGLTGTKFKKVPTSKTTLNPGTLKTLGSALGKFAAGAAAIAIVATTIALASDQINKYSKAAKEAAEQSQQAATAATAASGAYETLLNTIDEYKNAKTKISELTKGTQEYRDAILKANEAAMTLINTYDNIQFTTNADGLIEISEESLNTAKELQYEYMKSSQQFSLFMNQNAQNKKIESQKVDFERKKINSKGEGWQSAQNGVVAGGAGAAAGALGAIALGAAAGPVGWAALAVGIVAAVAGLIITEVVGDSNDKEDKVLQQLADVYEQRGNADFATDDALKNLLKNELKVDDERLVNSLVSNRQATEELVKEMSIANENNRQTGANAIQTEFGEEITNLGTSEEDVQKISLILGDEFTSYVDEVYEDEYKDKIGGLTDEDVQKQYAEAMGWSTDTIDNQSGNKATYYKKDGTEVGVISDAVARRYLAQQAVFKELSPSVQNVTKQFNSLTNSTKQYEQALADFLVDKNFSNMSESEFNDLVATIGGEDGKVDYNEAVKYANTTFGGEDGIISNEEAKAYGHKNAEEFYTSFFNSFSNFSINFNKVSESFLQTTQDIISENLVVEDLSSVDMQTIGSSIQSVLGTAGEEAAEYLAKTFYAKAGDEAGELASLFDSIEWEKMSLTELSKKINEAGLAVNYTNSELTNLIAIMSTGMSNTIESINNKMKLLDEVKKLQQGDIIDEEKYNQLDEHLQSYFTKMSDGTYQLTQDALAFYRAVQQNKVDEGRKNLSTNLDQLITDLNIKSLNWSEYAVNQGKEDYKGEYDSYEDYKKDKTKAPEDAYTTAPIRITTSTDYNMPLPNSDYYYTYKTPIWATDPSGKNTFAGEPYMDEHTWSVMEEQNKIIYDSARNSTYVEGEDAINTVSEQLELLSQTDWAKNSSENTSKLVQWTKDLENGILNLADANEIYNLTLSEGKGYYDSLGQSMEETAEKIKVGYQILFESAKTAEERAAILNNQNNAPTEELQKTKQELYDQSVHAAINKESYEGLDVAEIDEYAQHLEEVFEISKDGAADVARTVMKMNNGVEKLANGFEDWKDVLDKSSESSDEYFQAMRNIKNALSDVLDVSEEFISNDFVEKNLEKIQKAAEGSETAIDELSLALAEDIALESIKNTFTEAFSIEDKEAKIAEIQKLLDEVSALMKEGLPELKLGDSLTGEDELFAKMQEVVAAAGMTAEQANAYYRSMGFTPHFKMVEATQAESVPLTQTYHHREYIGDKDPETGEYTDWVDTEYQTTTQSPGGELKTALPALAMETADGQMPQVPSTEIESVTYTGGGSMNNRSSTNSGGKGSGGGGGGSKPTKSKGVKKSDSVKRYKEIEDSLDNVTRATKNAETAANRLYGKNRIKAMQDVNQLLAEEVTLLGEERKEAEKYLAEDKNSLNEVASRYGLNFQFNEDGDITNYEEEMSKLYEELKAATPAYGQKISEEQQEIIDNINEKISETQAAIDAYDETKEKIEDIDDQIQEKINKIQDNNLSNLEYAVELQIELNESDLKRIEYELSKIEDDFYSQAEGMALTGQQLDAYTANLETLEQQQKALEQMYKDGAISEDGYVQGLKTIEEQIYDNLSSIEDLKKTMEEYYTNTLDMANEELSKYTDKMEHLTSVVDHYSSIMELAGKAWDFKQMGNIIQGQVDMSKNALEVSKNNYTMMQEQANYWKTQMNNTVEGSEAWEIYKKNWEAAVTSANEAQEQMLSDTETYLENLQVLFENYLSQIGEQLSESLTGFSSLDLLDLSLEGAQQSSENFLTNTNKIYETSKMITEAQKELDATTNKAAKTKLNSFIQQTKQLQQQDELSQTELDIQQAKYNLLLAQIALEDARNAKSSMTLKRDASGNYSYVYTADSDKIADAEQKVADEENALYNTRLEAANDFGEQIVSTNREFYEALSELQTKRYTEGMSDEEFYAQSQQLYENYINKRSELDYLYRVATGEDANIIKESWVTSLVDQTASTEQAKIAIEQYLSDADSAYADYAANVKTATDEIGLDLNNTATAVQGVADAHTNLADEVNTKVIPALQNELDDIGTATTKWGTHLTELEKVTTEYSTLATNIAGIKTAFQNLDGVTLTYKIPKVGEDGTIEFEDKNLEMSVTGLKTGGYTGEWGPEGRWALLHEKELVLNAQDTENILAAVTMIRDLDAYLDNIIKSMTASLTYAASAFNSSIAHNEKTTTLQQEVIINAEFPAAESAAEIRTALETLTLDASQYINIM